MSRLMIMAPRTGVAFGPAMLFATGGVAFTDLKHTLTATDTSQTIADGGEGRTQTIGAATANLADSTKVGTGWAIGGGGEVRVSGKLSISLMLLHVDFDTKTLSDATAPSSISAKVRSKMFVGLLGMNFGF